MAKPISRETRARTQAIGDVAEDNFVKCIERMGLHYAKATTSEDMFKHIDIHVRNGKGKWSSFDIKAYKKCAEYGNILIEFKNVKGDNGWIYGEADYIAFDQQEDFLCVRRTDLLELALELCDLTNQVDHFSKALYKSYGRSKWGRDDQISLIKLTDIIDNLDHFYLKNP